MLHAHDIISFLKIVSDSRQQVRDVIYEWSLTGEWEISKTNYLHTGGTAGAI